MCEQIQITLDAVTLDVVNSGVLRYIAARHEACVSNINELTTEPNRIHGRISHKIRDTDRIRYMVHGTA